MPQPETSGLNAVPTVSVVIPSYNHADFVRACIESVRAQEFQDWELVITDDGSSDGTAAVLSELAAEDPRLHLNLFPANRGACVALNDAIARARGTYIAVLNSDDSWLPTKLSRQVAFLDHHPEYAAVFALPQMIDEQGIAITDAAERGLPEFPASNRSRIAWLDHFFRHGNCLCHQSILIRQAVYEEIGGYDPRLAQLPDLDYWVRLCARYDIHILNEPLVRYRILDNAQNASGARPEVLAREAWERLHVLRQYVALDLIESVQATDEAPYSVCALAEASPSLQLAWTALKIGTPAHRFLGLEIIHQAMVTGGGSRLALPSEPDYIKLTAASDVLWQGAMATCHRIQTELASSRAELEHQASETAQAPTEQAAAHAQWADQHAQIAELRSALTALQTSTFWRLTKPLRRLVEVLRRAGG